MSKMRENFEQRKLRHSLSFSQSVPLPALFQKQPKEINVAVSRRSDSFNPFKIRNGTATVFLLHDVLRSTKTTVFHKAKIVQQFFRVLHSLKRYLRGNISISVHPNSSHDPAMYFPSRCTFRNFAF